MSAPKGVRLRFPAGTAVECEVERAPQLDRQTRKGLVEYYTARPVQPVDAALTYAVECDELPPMTGFKVETGLDQRSLTDWAPPADTEVQP